MGQYNTDSTHSVRKARCLRSRRDNKETILSIVKAQASYYITPDVPLPVLLRHVSL